MSLRVAVVVSVGAVDDAVIDVSHCCSWCCGYPKHQRLGHDEKCVSCIATTWPWPSHFGDGAMLLC